VIFLPPNDVAANVEPQFSLVTELKFVLGVLLLDEGVAGIARLVEAGACPTALRGPGG
jgi:hypothetical protein